MNEYRLIIGKMYNVGYCAFWCWWDGCWGL